MNMSKITNDKTKRRGNGRRCRCGCLGVTRGGAYLPGHDMKHRGLLLAMVDEHGDWDAMDQLVVLG